MTLRTKRFFLTVTLDDKQPAVTAEQIREALTVTDDNLWHALPVEAKINVIELPNRQVTI